MIKLIVEPYCDNCPEFEAHVDRESFRIEQFDLEETIIENHTIITCEHREKCHGMKDWLAKQNNDVKN